ncbi:zinc finger, CCHC-type [Artemisia annua]|uniref:Zinc finger, CCHC-type n=1 Tax=Artemisia annua TaxID=35608 RepID=A0A2U1PH12_ARTAN|nr:zinc finger, CCHC-type [Artemisia annua]
MARGPVWCAVGQNGLVAMARRFFAYLLVYGGLDAELDVKCNTDAGFQTNRDDTRSQSGYVFIMKGEVVAWRSSKQSTIALSSTQAEYINVYEAA